MTKRRKVITNNNYNQIPQQQQFSQYPQQYQPASQQPIQPMPPHLQQTLNNQGQQPMGGNIRYPHLPYDANDVAQPVQQKPVQGHLQRIRQAKKGYNVPAPMPYQQVVNDDDYEDDEDNGAMQNQLFRYLQQEQAAKNGTAQMANMSALNYLQQIQAEAEEDEEGKPHNGYALAWIGFNAILSFAANLFFAVEIMGINLIVSLILATAFVFAPSFALWSARAMWRYIQKPGGWMKDGALITGFILSLAPLGISWLATVVLLSHILVFELPVALLVAYGAVAIATDLPQFVYFLRRK